MHNPSKCRGLTHRGSCLWKIRPTTQGTQLIRNPFTTSSKVSGVWGSKAGFDAREGSCSQVFTVYSCSVFLTYQLRFFSPLCPRPMIITSPLDEYTTHSSSFGTRRGMDTTHPSTPCSFQQMTVLLLCEQLFVGRSG